jgi:hypothetical protein
MASTISAGTTAGTALNMTGDTTGNLAFQTGAGANTITVPNGTGTMAVQGVSTNIVSGTAVASTSGTSIDFTSIPSWVKRVTVMFNGVSTNGASRYIVQFGNGSIVTSGYVCTYVLVGAATGNGTLTNGIGGPGGGAGDSYTGSIVFTLQTSNSWVAAGNIGYVGGGYMYTVTGSISLSSALDRVRITTVKGTDTFDAGTINILYE